MHRPRRRLVCHLVSHPTTTYHTVGHPTSDPIVLLLLLHLLMTLIMLQLLLAHRLLASALTYLLLVVVRPTIRFSYTVPTLYELVLARLYGHS